MVRRKNFCFWLVNILQNQRLTYQEIHNKWMNSSSNDTKEDVPRRTFTRYCRYAENLFDIEIKCDRSRGDVYTITGEGDGPLQDIHKWLLSAHSVASLSDRIKQRDKIIVEAPPTGTDILGDVIDAIDNNQGLKIVYKSHYSDTPKEHCLIPCFVRLFKQRWYVIGEDKNKNKPYTFALERILSLELTEHKMFTSPQLKDTLNANNFYDHCFGVTRQGDPITIKFRAYTPQDLYIKDVPIHTSQKTISQTNDYTDFEIFVRPTYDLIQELLNNREQLQVLSPKSLRVDIKRIITEMLNRYQ